MLRIATSECQPRHKNGTTWRGVIALFDVGEASRFAGANWAIFLGAKLSGFSHTRSSQMAKASIPRWFQSFSRLVACYHK